MSRPHLRRTARRPKYSRRQSLVETLEPRQLLAIWQNPLHPLDVSDDGFIAPLDALLIINAVNASGIGSLPAEIEFNDPYYDTSGDGYIAPLDAVLVINQLNAGARSSDIELSLVNDTGRSSADRITREAVTAGHVPLHYLPGTLIGRYDRGDTFVISASASGDFQLDPVAQAAIEDGTLKLGVAYTHTDGQRVVTQLQITLDRVAPGAPLALGLTSATDTGTSTTDRVTKLVRPTFESTVEASATVEFIVDGAALGSAIASGETARLPSTADLAEGVRSLRARVTDAAGNIGPLSNAVNLTIDITPPPVPDARLSTSSDSGAPGDGITNLPRVTLVGTTIPGAPVAVTSTGFLGLADGEGRFQIPGVTLQPGANALFVQASDVAGNLASRSLSLVLDTSTATGDPVVAWNLTALEIVRLEASTPLQSSRALAMVHLAILDAISAIDGTPGYLVKLTAPAGASAEAALAAAAHRTLSYLFPRQASSLDAILATRLAAVPNSAAKTAGIDFGRAVAQGVIDVRDADGWDDFVDFPSSTAVGEWRTTEPMYEVALAPQWADLTPFAMSSPDQFRPAGPPDLNSAEYATDYAEVKALGAASGSTRTPEQTQIARFWADGPGTFTPPGHWNQIAGEFATNQNTGLLASARMFATLNVALADAGIAAWDAKYSVDLWRPISAIQEGDSDGNAVTIGDPQWTSLILTPPFPEYISGHSTFSAAAAEVLTAFFGDSLAFATTSVGLPTVQRNFTSFRQAAEEAGRSRVYGGIHYEFSNQDGQTTGRSVGQQALASFGPAIDTVPPKLLIDAPAAGLTTPSNVVFQGRVFDNLSGVAALHASVDGGDFLPVTYSSTGEFTIATNLVLTGGADGQHIYRFQAADHAGLQTNAEFSFVLDTRVPTIAVAQPAATATIEPGARLAGTASGTGSAIVKLTYQIDGGAIMNLPYDSAGAFDQLLDLWRLDAGVHSLSITALDASGLVATSSRTFTLATDGPLMVSAISPADGSQQIGVTFRPQVFFSRPVDRDTLTNNNFYATGANGAKLPAIIVPAQDGTFAWLMFPTPLPGGATISVHVVGGTIRDHGGAPLDADGDGVPGGELVYSFSTVSVTPIPGTTLVGRVVDPGNDLAPMTFDDMRAGPDGVPHTPDDVFLNSIAHAHVFVLGLESQAVFTDASGFFTLPNMPAGNVKLVIDGRTATNSPSGAYWPEMVMDLSIEPGRENTIMGTMGSREEREANLDRSEVYLPRIELSALQTISSTIVTNVTVDGRTAPNLSPEQQAQLKLAVQPLSVIGEDGQPVVNPQVGISTVPPQLVRDMLPPGVLQHTFDITIQAPGAAVFNAPLEISFPNVFNSAPGTQLSFLSFDHTTGRLVIEGTATVSPDGLSVVTDPGTGVTKPGWHGLTNEGGCGITPPPEEEPEKTPEDTDEEEEDVHHGPFLVPDDYGTPEEGSQGEDGPKATLLRIQWSAPFKDDDPRLQPPPRPDACPASPPQNQRLQTTKMKVEISVDGPLTKFGTSEGDVNMTGDHFVLLAGSEETRELKISLKDRKAIFDQPVEENYLFVAEITIKTTFTDRQGVNRSVTTKNYVYAFVDATDSNPQDRTVSFEKTVIGATRSKRIIVEAGKSQVQLKKGTGANFDVSGAANAEATYHPSAEAANESGTLDIIAPKNVKVGSIQLQGKGIKQQGLYIDQAGFKATLTSIYQSTMPSEYKHIFETAGTFDPQRVTSFVSAVVSNVTQRLAPFSQGIALTGDVPNAAFNTGFGTTTTTLPLGASGVDADDGRIRDLIETLEKKSKAAAAFELSQLVNIVQRQSLDHYVNSFFHLKKGYTPNESELIYSMGMNIAHEFGHTLGLHHTRAPLKQIHCPPRLGETVWGPCSYVEIANTGWDVSESDVMAQGIDPTNRRDWSWTAEAIKLGTGMEWTPIEGARAISYYARYFSHRPPNNGLFEQYSFNEFPINDFAHPGLGGFDGALLIPQTLDGAFLSDPIDFGLNVVGAPAASRFVSLENIGGAPSRITKVSIVGGGGQFTLPTTYTTFELAPGSIGVISVDYTPAAAGDVSATLVIESIGISPRIEIPLHAKAQTSQPKLAFEAINNNLGGAPLNEGAAIIHGDVYTITNHGAAPLSISGIDLADGAAGFTLRDIPANLATQPIVLAYGDTFSFGASFKPNSAGLSRAIVRITSNDATTPVTTATLVGTGYTRLYPQWGSDFVAIQSQDAPNVPALRTVSQTNGSFDVFLPANQRYHEVIFDPVTGLVAHGYGRTSPSGQNTNLTGSLVFRASTAADTDFDGLPEDVEFAIGTASARGDSDGDGLDDFAEVMQGLDPLTNRNPPVGVIASVALEGEAIDVAVTSSPLDTSARIAYVATGNFGLAVVDVTNVNAPIVLSQVSLPGFNQDLAVDVERNLVAVAAGTSGLHLFDISNPARPDLLQSIPLVGQTTAVEIYGGIAYVVSAGDVVSIDLASYEVLERLPLSNITSFTREGDKLYVATSYSLRIIDLSGYGMTLRGEAILDFRTESARNLFVGGDIAYVTWEEGSAGSTVGGYSTIDVSDPDSPVLISAPDTPNGVRAPRSGLVPNGSGLGLLFDASGRVIDVMDVGNPLQTYLPGAQFNLGEGPYAVSPFGGYALLASGGSGVHVLNYGGYDIQGQAPTIALDSVAVDADPGAPGLQVFEGSTVPIRASVVDDVRVQGVEWIVDGVVVASDFSFPWDFAWTAPLLASGASSFVVQARTTDTGGNARISVPLTIGITPDNSPGPAVVSAVPPEGSQQTTLGSLRVNFSKPIDPATISPAGITLTFLGANGAAGGGDDVLVALRPFEWRNLNRTLVIIPEGSLQPGAYQLKVLSTAVKDLVGNELAATFTRSFNQTGIVAAGQQVSGVISVAGQTDTFRFMGNFGQRMFIDSLDNDSETIRGTLRSPSGVVVWDAHLSSNVKPFTLIETGAYQLTVYGFGSATGDYVFRLLDGSAAPLLSLGTPVSGTLTSKRTDIFRVVGQAGERLRPDYLGQTSVDVWTSIYSPGNQEIDVDVLTADGEYLVTVEEYFSPGTVDYQVAIVSPGESTNPLTLNQTVSGNIGLPGERDRYTFTGTLGQMLYFDAVDPVTPDLTLQITDANGENVRYFGFPGANNDAGPFVLHAIGEHTLTISSSAATGPYRFRLLDLAAAPAITLNTSIVGTVNSPKEVLVFQYAASAGQNIYIGNLGGVNSARYSLYTPSGILVDGWSHTDINHSVFLPVGGTYFLVIDNTSATTGYNYNFRFDIPQISATALALGTEASGTMTSRGDVHSYTFAGTAGQQIYFDNMDGTANTRRLIAPSGTEVFSTTSGFSNFGSYALAETGTYRFEIRPAFGSTTAAVPNNYRFRFLDLAASIPLSAGVPTTAAFTTGVETLLYRIAGTAGDKLTVTRSSASRSLFTNNEKWIVLDQQGRPLINTGLGTDFSINFPVTGNYVLALAASTNNAPLNLGFQIAIASGALIVPAGFGTLLTGTVPASGQATVTFDGNAGMLVYLDFVPGGAGSMSSSLRDPLNNSLSSFALTSSTDAIGPIVLPLTGTYSFRMPTNPSAAQSGAYALKFVDVAGSATPVVIGQPTAGSVPARETRFFKFTATAGQSLYVNKLVNGSMSIITPENRTIFLGEDLLRLSAGEHYLVVQNFTSTASNYNFVLMDAGGAPAVGVGVHVAGTLPVANPAAFHRFEATAGATILIETVQPTNFSTSAYVFGPDGKPIYSSSFPTYESVAPITGTYYALISAIAPSDPINFDVVIHSAGGGSPIQIGDAISGSTSSYYEQLRYTFSAAAGQRLFVDALVDNHNISIFSPTGFDLGDEFNSPNIAYGSPRDLLSYVLTETGTYTLVFDGGTGAVQARLLEVSNVPVLPFNTNTTAALSPQSQAVIYQFHGDAGQRFYLDNRSFFDQVDVLIVDTAGNLIASAGYDFIFSTPQAGDYLLVISRSNIASFPFQLATIEDDVRPIAVNTPYQGNIDRPGKRGIYTFVGHPGQRITFDSQDVDFNMNLDVLIQSPSGATVLQAGEEHAPITLLESGQYRVIVGGSDDLGTFNFQIVDAETSPALLLETNVTGNLTPGATNVFYRWDGLAGQRLFFDATSFSSTSGTWTLYGPGNQSLASAQFRNDMELVLPGTGTYLLQLAGQILTPINYAFTLYAPLPAIAPLALDTPISGTLDKPGETDVYTFTAAAGDRFYYDAHDTTGTALTVRIENAAGATMTGTSGDAHTDRVPFALAAAGDYRLIIDGTGQAIGTYQFRLASVAAAAVAPIGSPVAASLDPGREADVYRFNGAAGQALLFDMLSTSSTQGTWYLYGPNNQLFKSAALGTDFSHTLPGAGTYVLVVSGNLAATINYQFQISSALLAAAGETVGNSIAPPAQADLDRLLAAAVSQYLALGLSSADTELLSRVRIEAVQLDGALLGAVSPDKIWIDDDAAGWGWFIDPTPEADEEFLPGGTALDDFDLLTVISHELGHLLGVEHSDDPNSLFAPTLGLGQRRRT